MLQSPRLASSVLVVEDDLDLREMMVQVLWLEGFNVTTAENGQVALSQLAHEPKPRLIVLDLMMPVMDGWQFRQHQCARPDLADIPVVVVSAVPEHAAGIGAADILPKPINIDRLLAAVRRHYER